MGKSGSMMIERGIVREKGQEEPWPALNKATMNQIEKI